MAGFLYFVATDQPSASPQDLERWGLSYAFTVSPTGRQTGLTVDGAEVRGLLLTQDGDHEVTPRIDESSQVWRERAEVGGVRSWVGLVKDDEPTPELLSRGLGLNNYEMHDARGRAWRVPWVGDVEAGEWVTMLPREADFTASGEMVHGAVVERFRELWRRSEALWAEMVKTDDLSPSVAGPFACELLQTLYRVSFVEIGMLGVFSQEFRHSPVYWVGRSLGIYDWIAWQEAKEKGPLSHPEEAAGSSTSGGEAA